MSVSVGEAVQQQQQLFGGKLDVNEHLNVNNLGQGSASDCRGHGLPGLWALDPG